MVLSPVSKAPAFHLSARDRQTASEAFNAVVDTPKGKMNVDCLGPALRKAGIQLAPYKVRKLSADHQEWTEGVPFEDFVNIVATFKAKDPTVAFQILTKAESVREVTGTDDVTFHSIRDEEKVAFSEWINNVLGEDKYLTQNGYLPLDPSGKDVFTKSADGIMLVKLINATVPGTLDEKRLNYGRKMFKVKAFENNNLCLQGCKTIGCSVFNIGAEEIYMAKPHLILALMWQIIRIGLLRGINLDFHPAMSSKLLHPDEDPKVVCKESPEKILIRWVNYHMVKANTPRRMANFTTDIRDSVIYTHLLHQITPRQHGCTLEPLKKKNEEERASAVLDEAEKAGCKQFLKPTDITNGSYKLNLAFVANLFNNHHGLDKDKIHIQYNKGWPKLLQPGEKDEALLHKLPEEDFLKRWVNFHLERAPTDRRLNNYDNDLKDGVIYVYLLQQVAPEGSPVDREILKTPSDGDRAKKILEIPIAKENNKGGLAPQNISNGHAPSNITFLCHLFNKNHGLTEPEPALKHTEDIDILLKPDEDIDTLKKLPAEVFIPRWVNFQLKQSPREPQIGEVQIGSRDLADGKAYAYVLERIAEPGDGINVVDALAESITPEDRSRKVIDEAKKLNCGTKVKPEEITDGIHRKNVVFLVELYNKRPALEERVILKHPPEAKKLLKPGENLEQVNPKEFLTRWVNYHLEGTAAPKKMSNFGPDLVDCEIYVHLVRKVVPEGTITTTTIEILEEKSPEKRAEKLKNEVQKVDLQEHPKPEHLIAARQRHNVKFLAEIYNKFHGLEEKPPKGEEMEVRELTDPFKGERKGCEVMKPKPLPIEPEPEKAKGTDEKFGTGARNTPVDKSSQVDVLDSHSEQPKSKKEDKLPLYSRIPQGQPIGKLQKPEECPGKIAEIPDDDLLKRWVNYHLGNSSTKRKLNKYDSDLKDAVIYSHLLKQVAPKEAKVTLDPLSEPEPVPRAKKFLKEAEKVGCGQDLKPEDITEGNEPPNKEFLEDLLCKYPGLEDKKDEKPPESKKPETKPVEIELICPPEVSRLLKPNESQQDTGKIKPEEFLKRWVNYHLQNSPSKRRLANFSNDVKDSEIYSHLLNQIAPKEAGVTLEPLNETSLPKRAEKVVEEAKKLNVSDVVTPDQIVNGERIPNVKFLAELFNKHNALEREPDLVLPAEIEQLLQPGEQLDQLPIKDILVRWVNYQLDRSPCKRRIVKFPADIKDSEIYAHLIKTVAPPCAEITLEPLAEKEPTARAVKLLKEAEKVECAGKMKPEDITRGRERPNMLLLSRLLSKYPHLGGPGIEEEKGEVEGSPEQKVILECPSGVYVLLMPHEKDTDMQNIQPEELLLRWVNYHLAKTPYNQQPIRNLTTDLIDCEAYAYLLKQIAPQHANVTLRTVEEENRENRPRMIAEEAIKMSIAIYPDHIAKGDKNANLAFLAELFNKYNELPPEPELALPHEICVILKPEERVETVPPNELLIRWVNFQLEKTPCPRRVQKIPDDLVDCEIYFYLLKHVVPEDKNITTEPLAQPDPQQRAVLLLIELEKANIRPPYFRPEDIFLGRERPHTDLLAIIMSTYHNLTFTPEHQEICPPCKAKEVKPRRKSSQVQPNRKTTLEVCENVHTKPKPVEIEGVTIHPGHICHPNQPRHKKSGAKVLLVCPLEITRLLRPGETTDVIPTIRPDDMLLRWVNFHLKRSPCQREMTNYAKDIQDSEIYTYLLKQIAPPSAGVTLDPLNDKDPLLRATKVIAEAKKINCGDAIRPEEIAGGKAMQNLEFVEQLFNAENALQVRTVPTLPQEAKTYLKPGERFETVCKHEILKRWANSQLDKTPCQKRMYNFTTDVEDSQIYVHLLKEIAPETANVTLAPLEEKDNFVRAEKTLKEAEKIGCGNYLVPQDIAFGISQPNVIFVAELMRKYPALEPKDKPGKAPSVCETVKPVEKVPTKEPPTLKHTPHAESLLLPGETLAGVPLEEFLIRWVNYHLGRSPSKRRMTNFTSDTADSEIYVHLVKQIAPGEANVTLSPLTQKSLLNRAMKFLGEAEKIKCGKVIKPQDISTGSHQPNLYFVAYLYNHHPKLEPGLALKYPEDIGILLRNNEKPEQVPVPELLMRWVNHQLQNCACDRRMRGLNDVTDSEIYTYLLSQIAPHSAKITLDPVKEKHDEDKAKALLKEAAKVKAADALTPEDIVKAREGPNVKFLSKLFNEYPALEDEKKLAPLKRPKTGLEKLLLPGEEKNKIKDMKDNDLLIRWVNFQVGKSREPSCPKTMENFRHDVRDGTIYCHLLRQVAPKKGATCNLEPLKEPDGMPRAEKVLKEAEKIKARTKIEPIDIVSGNHRRNRAFVANLFNNYPNVTDKPEKPILTIKYPQNVKVILGPNEKPETVPVPDLLMRWVNHQLENCACDKRMRSVDDVTDSKIYTFLLSQIAPHSAKVTLDPLKEKSEEDRAKALLKEAAKLKAGDILTPDDIVRAKKEPNVNFLTKLFNDNPALEDEKKLAPLKRPAGIELLLLPGEQPSKLTDMKDNDLLIRWVNYQVGKSKNPSCPRTMENFRHDVRDCALYCHLLREIAPEKGGTAICSLEPLKEPDEMSRAEKTLQEAEKIKARTKIEPVDVVSGNHRRNRAFVANMYNNHPNLGEKKATTPLTTTGGKPLIHLQPGCEKLLKKGETMEDLEKLPIEEILKRWVNHHVSKTPCKKRMKNFTTDVSDSELYANLLTRIAPKEAGVTLEPLTEPDLHNRADKTLNEAAKLNCRQHVTPNDIAKGEHNPNVAFTYHLFSNYPCLEGKEPSDAKDKKIDNKTGPAKKEQHADDKVKAGKKDDKPESSKTSSASSTGSGAKPSPSKSKTGQSPKRTSSSSSSTPRDKQPESKSGKPKTEAAPKRLKSTDSKGSSAPSKKPPVGKLKATPKGNERKSSVRRAKPNVRRVQRKADYVEDRDEKTLRNWINSLGLHGRVGYLYSELNNGILIFKIMDCIEPGIVDWDRVNPASRSMTAFLDQVANGNYAIALGRKMGFSLVGIEGKDIVDGSKVHTLSLVWQLMRSYTLKIIQSCSGSDKKVGDDHVVQWVNRKLEKSGKKTRLESLADPQISSSKPVLELIDAIQPKEVKWEHYIEPQDMQDRLLNARYALSLSRKLGAKIYALPEDLAEVKTKMVLTVFACLMAVDFKPDMKTQQTAAK